MVNPYQTTNPSDATRIHAGESTWPYSRIGVYTTVAEPLLFCVLLVVFVASGGDAFAGGHVPPMIVHQVLELILIVCPVVGMAACCLSIWRSYFWYRKSKFMYYAVNLFALGVNFGFFFVFLAAYGRRVAIFLATR